MTLFTDKAPWVMAALMEALNIDALDAAAILGNIGHESMGFKSLAQINGSAYGWPQWDGVRRDAYFKWCKANKMDRASDEANYRYLVYELTDTWEKRVIPALKQVVTLDRKVEVFDDLFERSGVKNYPSRKAWAKKALDAYNAAGTIAIPAFAGGGAVAAKPASDPVQAVSSFVPPTWMQRCEMKRVIAHWSAGAYTVSALDKEHYHIIVDGDGKLAKGDHDISDNVNTADDDYAAHTRGTNTGSIGISLACMAGAIEKPFNPGRYPMKKIQWDAMVAAIADLASFYSIPVTPKTVLSHAEVQGTLGIKQAGKWDFTRLAFDDSVVGAKACGDKMRAEVQAVLDAGGATYIPPPPDIESTHEPAAPASGGFFVVVAKILAALFNAFFRKGN